MTKQKPTKQERRDLAWKEYEKITNSAWKEYQKIEKPAYKEYEKKYKEIDAEPDEPKKVCKCCGQEIK